MMPGLNEYDRALYELVKQADVEYTGNDTIFAFQIAKHCDIELNRLAHTMRKAIFAMFEIDFESLAKSFVLSRPSWRSFAL